MGAEREVRGVADRRTRGGEMLPTLAVGWRASALRGGKAGRFRRVAGMSIIAAGAVRLLGVRGALSSQHLMPMT